jgi:hypothetical protein
MPLMGWISWTKLRQWLSCLVGVGLIAWIVLVGLGDRPALASLQDDKFDGDIFALYAGNGSLVPPKRSLKDSLGEGKPAIVIFYIDDSKDCKQFSLVVSNLQAYYGRVASFIPIRVDSLPAQATYEPPEAAYYYKGYVPQTVVFDQTGQVRLDASGQVAFETIDDVMRQVFDLLPRSDSVTLKRRPLNQVSTELSP